MNKILTTTFLAIFGLGAMSANAGADDESPFVLAQSTEALRCVAVAKGDAGEDHVGAIWYSGGDSEENAKKLALDKCEEKTTNCKVLFSECG